LDEIGQSIRLNQISSVANAILENDHIKNGPAPTVGHHWPRRFLDRHPELRKAKQKSLELERKLAHNPDVILKWFQRFDKREFLATITDIRRTTFKRNSILSAFRECGLVPYNPQIDGTDKSTRISSSF
jgi:Tc5 transposase DNA-binding domain